MPNTFSQKYIQVVFTGKYREALIDLAWEERLYNTDTQYIIVQKKGTNPPASR